jgi:FHA domain
MTTLQPVSVALKFGFLAVMYLFLVWVARSALRDLRTPKGAPRGAHASGRGEASARSGPDGANGVSANPEATGLYSASSLGPVDIATRAPRLVVERAPGHDPGMIYDLDGNIVLGRGEQAEIRLEDPFASSSHARIYERGGALVIEDMGSTNGTYLNEELLETPRPLHPEDRVRIGDSEFAFEVD